MSEIARENQECTQLVAKKKYDKGKKISHITAGDWVMINNEGQFVYILVCSNRENNHNFPLLLYFIQKCASLACDAQLVDTVSSGGAICATEVTLINFKGDNIPKYACPTVKIDIAREITKFDNFLII